jgi:hypothetical protein
LRNARKIYRTLHKLVNYAIVPCRDAQPGKGAPHKEGGHNLAKSEFKGSEVIIVTDL